MSRINPIAGPNRGQADQPVGPRGSRDYEGYGAKPPHPQWPGGALLAVNFVLNYEEGSEQDDATDKRSSRTLIEDSIAFKGRDMAAESMFEYGSRVGFWRIFSLFERNKVPLTMYAAARALENKPETCAVLRKGIDAGMVDICGHGLRWHPLQEAFPENEEGREIERQILRGAAESFAKTVGTKPGEMGWYTAWAPSAYTRELLAEEGWLCDSDCYNDELPYWTRLKSGKPWLVVPYSIVMNDYKYSPHIGALATGDDFFEFVKGAVDQLLDEARYQAQSTRAGGSVTAAGFVVPKMLSIWLHNRVIGHSMRANGLRKSLEYLSELREKGEVWLTRRTDIARHWMKTHPPPPEAKL